MFGAPINPIATGIYGISCLVLGAALALFLERRARARRAELPDLNWYEEDAIDYAARTWAEQEGRPHLAGIAASYIKLGTRFQRRETGASR